MQDSLIVDWNFGLEIGVPGGELDTFLVRAETLRRKFAGGQSLAEPLGDVRRLGRWARIYLLHDLCEAMRFRKGTPDASIISNILLDLVEDMPAEVAEILAAAVQETSRGTEASEIIELLGAAAARLMSSVVPDREKSLLDFSDLELRDAETLLLALLVQIMLIRMLAILRLGGSDRPALYIF